MEVKMNKEIRDYQESMFMGLDLRQCVCSVLAILTAIGIYFGMRDITGQEITGWLCVLGAAPFAACGFFKYHGMTAEQFLWAVIKSELLYPKKLVFQSEDIHYSCMQETISLGVRRRVDAEDRELPRIRLHEPRDVAHEGRLPRAVNADKRHDDVGWHGERQVGERFNVLPIRPHERLREAARRDDRGEISHKGHPSLNSPRERRTEAYPAPETPRPRWKRGSQRPCCSD